MTGSASGERAAFARGFTLLDRTLGAPRPNSRLLTVVDVAYGHATDWRLRVTLEDHRETTVWFENPTVFRVLDDGELLDYWGRRSEENVAVGTLYSIRESPFLAQLGAGVTAQSLGVGESLTHYLIAGMDVCVEVISGAPPTFADESGQPAGRGGSDIRSRP